MCFEIREHKEDAVTGGSVTAGLQLSQNSSVLITCVLARSSCWKPSTSLLSSAALSWTSEGRTNITHRLNKAQIKPTTRRSWESQLGTEAHHEDAEHHVVVVDEEDELISPGGKLCRHLQNKVFNLDLQKNKYSCLLFRTDSVCHSLTSCLLLQPVNVTIWKKKMYN